MYRLCEALGPARQASPKFAASFAISFARAVPSGLPVHGHPLQSLPPAHRAFDLFAFTKLV